MTTSLVGLDRGMAVNFVMTRIRLGPIRWIATSLAIVVLAAGCGSREPATPSGSIDASFGASGKILTAAVNGHAMANAMLVLRDGRFVVGGSQQAETEGSFLLARYNPDGTLDSTFGGSGVVTTAIGGYQDSVTALVLQPDGRMVAAGYSWNGSDYRVALVRYTVDGALDSTFGRGGIVVAPGVDGVHEVALAAALQSDGKIVVAGYRGSDTATFALSRFAPDGMLDSSFGRAGKVSTPIAVDGVEDVAYAVAIQLDGKIVAAGSSYAGAYRVAAARYLPSGQLDPGFGVGGIVTTMAGSESSVAYGLALDATGAVYLGGGANNGAADAFAVVKYTDRGVVDASFGSGGVVRTEFGAAGATGSAVVLLPDGKLLLAGYNDGTLEDTETPTGWTFALARYRVDGSLDVSFGTEGRIVTGIGDGIAFAVGAAVQENDRILLGGTATEEMRSKLAVVRYIQ